MSKNFSWENFSTEFIKSVVYSENTPKTKRPDFNTDDKSTLIAFMDNICKKPDEHFVRRYRNEITDSFLANSTHIVSLVKGLEKNKYKGIKTGSIQEMSEQLKSLRLTSSVLTLILGELYREGNNKISDDAEFSIFTTPKRIDVKACIPDDIAMYEYQKDANAAMYKHFVEDDKIAGILSMPTGSGKTRTAVRFLMENMVACGRQVIWLTHRAMLIDQTAEAIYNCAGALLRKSAPHMDEFRMICVSGSHCSIKAASVKDDVMICSVQTLIRNLAYLPAVIRENVLIVVDEAHHTLAPSYRAIIKEIRSLAGDVKLLGLTATPARISAEDTARLMKIFDNKIVYNISTASLVAKGYLSTPQYEQIDTDIDFETTILPEERKYIQKWGELSPETMDRIARMKERNTIIADTYVNNKEKYGKTVIFALNGIHCIALCEELQSRGIRCDYVYCAHSGNEEKIARFKRGELDVLVNIQVLTEGSDVPDIQTVFLTRPTTSDVLLMQMIGRGMRGVGSGGTETVNIVDFNDMWGSIANWLTAKQVMSVLDYIEDADETSDTSSGKEREEIPWAMIRDFLSIVSTNYTGIGAVGNICSLPVGWYDIIDEDGNDSKVLVFESQLSGYLNMWKNREKTLDNPDFDAHKAILTWFDGFSMLPSANDVERIVELYRMTGEFPHLHQFSHRKKTDAAYVARKLIEENVRLSELNEKISQVYEDNREIIDSLYGSFDEYSRRVVDFIHYPNGIKPLGMRIEEIEELPPDYNPNPVYNIDELVNEVVAEMFNEPREKFPPVMWTSGYRQSFFGMYHHRPEGDFIFINSILNSESVPVETVKYIIYHELLHRDYWNHDSIFRYHEHKYPDWTSHERFLDVEFPKFSIDYSL